MSICETVQNHLAEEGIDAVLADEAMRRHLEACVECGGIRDALGKLDDALSALPEHEAPDQIVADSLRTVVSEGPPRVVRFNRRHLAGAMAATVAIAAVLGVLPALREFSMEKRTETVLMAVDREIAPLPRSTERPSSEPPRKAVGKRKSSDADVSRAKALAERASRGSGSKAVKKDRVPAGTSSTRRLDVLAERDVIGRLGREEELVLRLQQSGIASAVEAETPKETYENKRLSDAGTSSRPGRTADVSKNEDKAFADNSPDGAYRKQQLEQRKRLREPAEGLATHDDLRLLRKTKPQSIVGQDEKSAKTERESAQTIVGRSDHAGTGGRYRERQALAPNEEPSPRVSGFINNRRGNVSQARQLARDYLQRIASTSGLNFQTPHGYWANTYIPGDPDMHLALSRLKTWDRRHLGIRAGLEQRAQQVVQMFDPPNAAAMSLFVHADTKAIEGPTRLRVQIGVKGATRRGGYRPAMNVGLVLDLSEGTMALSPSLIRAVTDALRRVRQAGDRFSLTVAGPKGGLLVPADAFRHGPLQVAIERSIAASSGTDATHAVELTEAISLAAASVRANERPDAVLGASMIILVTGGINGDDLPALENLAHMNAVGGIPMSVFTLNGVNGSASVDRLAAAGQGSRRYMKRVEDAEVLVDRELHAASRAIARALRLRIRLAPGVRLVGVLGSRRLQQTQVRRARQAEQSIDRRLARDLGISADRGEDEEGIQIVIPNFYAGDEHVILLDVVASTAGHVADVSLRYKDVLLLKNGVSHAGLTLPAGRHAPGPMEQNVLKNLLAFEVAQRSRDLSRLIDAGAIAEASHLVRRLKILLAGLRNEVPAWASDPDLMADEAMLDDFLNALHTPATRDPVQQQLLADSFRFAAFRKLHGER
jgi:hypothetical protein